MKLILCFAIALSIFPSLGFAAPFKKDSIAVYLKFTITNGCYIQEYDISGTQLDSYMLPSGYTCDAGKIAQLDLSGSILVVPMVKNTDTKIVTLNPNKDIVDTTTIPGVNFYSALVSGNDMWLIANDVGYTTRGSSGAPVTQNIAGFIEGNPPISRSGQLVGTRLLFLNLDSLWQINPVVKTGTGSVTKVLVGSNQVLANQFYVHKSTNLYTYYGSSSSLNKYSFVNGAATLQYSITLSISVISITAMDVNGVTYVLISYNSGSTYTLVRYTDTGSTFNGQTTVMTTSVAEIRSVSASPKATCSDGFKDQDETDIDCGGAVCSRCANTKACSLSTDCTSNYCNPNKICSTPGCTDGFKNQDETDVDCGGTKCDKCADGKGCSASRDCSSAVCNSGLCAVPTCNDGVKNQDETDVDCGGAKCSKCADGKGCAGSGDCSSGVCNSGSCAVPTCEDSVMNGDETDVDCGGGGLNNCTGCAIDKKCTLDSDCAGLNCVNNLCAASCQDNILNQDESDIDCGGSNCSKRCDDNKGCTIASDCSSGVCTADTCAVPSCEDSVMNGDETDVDCGGGLNNCTGCAIDKKCTLDSDCAGLNCVSNWCAASCQDNILNQDETDIDCGGSQCTKCPDDKICLNNTDCNSSFCTPINLCRTPTCEDTYQNQDETDIDCGGSTCSKCAVGKKCVMDSDCGSNTCISNTCVEVIPPVDPPVSSMPITQKPVSVGTVIKASVCLTFITLAMIIY